MIVSTLMSFQGHIIRSHSRVPSLKYKEEPQISEQNNSLPSAKLFFFSCMANLTECRLFFRMLAFQSKFTFHSRYLLGLSKLSGYKVHW